LEPPMRFAYLLTCVMAGVVLGCIPAEAPPEQPVQTSQAEDPGDTVEETQSEPPAAGEPAPAPPEVQPQAGSNGAKPGAPATEELLAEWNTLAEEPALNMSNPRLVSLGLQLKTKEPEAVKPLIEILGDPDAAPEQKVMVVVTLQGLDFGDEVIEMLKPLVEQDRETTTRASATQLLAFAQDRDLKPMFENLLDDPSPRVRLAALQGLAGLGDQDAFARMEKLYGEEDTTAAEKNRIVQTLARFPEPEYRHIYREALTNPLLEAQSVLSAAAALSMVGETEDLDVIEEALDVEHGEQVTNMLHMAKLSIQRRAEESQSAGGEEDTPKEPVAPAADDTAGE